MAEAAILVVDDDAPILRMLDRTLSAEGYAVETAADGGQALAAVGRSGVEAWGDGGEGALAERDGGGVVAGGGGPRRPPAGVAGGGGGGFGGGGGGRGSGAVRGGGGGGMGAVRGRGRG